MRRIRKLIGLPAWERHLLFRTTLLVSAARIALWTLPFSCAYRVFNRKLAIAPRLAGIPAERLAWAVGVAARWIPRATCLTQALSLQYLLGWSGRESCVHIGVAKKADSGFESHAWVESGGKILIGDNGELHRFSPILVLSTEET